MTHYRNFELQKLSCNIKLVTALQKLTTNYMYMSVLGGVQCQPCLMVYSESKIW